MEPIINFTEPFTVLVATILFVLILLLGRETKRSILVGLMLGVFILIIVGHTMEFMLYKEVELKQLAAACITIDFVFIGISYFSYLWIDDIEAKEKKKKSIDNSLDWFWKKV